MGRNNLELYLYRHELSTFTSKICETRTADFRVFMKSDYQDRSRQTVVHFALVYCSTPEFHLTFEVATGGPMASSQSESK